MEPELKTELEALRASLGKNVEALARLDKLEVSVNTGITGATAMRAELDALKAAHADREQAIKALQDQANVQRLAADPLKDKREALAMLGMIARAELARANRMELPAAFRGEVELVRGYQERMLQRATLTPGSATGSYIVPTITENQVLDTLEEISDLLSRVDFVPGLPACGTMNLPTLTGRPTLQPAKASSDTKMTQSDPTFGTTSLSPKEAYIYFPVDNRLFAMTAVALGSLLLQVLRDGIAGGISTWLLSGDGTASYNSITGILKEATADYIVNMPAGKKAFSDLAKSDLTALKAKCLKRGRARGVFLLAHDVLGLCEDMDRTGKTPVVTEIGDGSSKVLRSPAVIEEGMPDLADSAPATGFIAFGDLATILVGMIGGIQIASDTSYLFGNNQTAFRGIINMDIIRKPVKTLMLLKTAAA